MDNVSFKVNCAEGKINIKGYDFPNYQGGKLIITNTQFIFNPHMFNVGNTSPRYYNIVDILNFDKGFLTELTIFLTDNRCVKLTTWSKDKIISLLNERKNILSK